MATIHRLAGRGDPFELLALLEGGADPNDAKGQRGRTPLMEAANHNNIVAIRLLFKFNANLDAADARGRTPLMEASKLSTKRLLLDAGANPDFGRIGGMTLMAFFASFRDRKMVDFLREYGADTAARIRKGPSVQEALDDPEFGWRALDLPDTPDRRRSNNAILLKLSDNLRITPERYVSDHRNILIWSFGSSECDDSRLKEWAVRVSELLASPGLLETAYRQNLEGEALAEALRSMERPKRRAERDCLRKARDAEFAAIHFPGETLE